MGGSPATNTLTGILATFSFRQSMKTTLTLALLLSLISLQISSDASAGDTSSEVATVSDGGGAREAREVILKRLARQDIDLSDNAKPTKKNRNPAQARAAETSPNLHIQAERFYLIPNARTVNTLEAASPEGSLWSAIDPAKPCEYQAYLEQYPQGNFAPLARLRLKECQSASPDTAPARQASAPTTRSVAKDFKDCPECPEMVVIPAGSFQMGSVNGDEDEKPVHAVRIAKPFALAKTEVTQAQWRAIMCSNPSQFSGCGDNCPVEKVSWDDAQEYLRRLSAKTGQSYRLPSEAEWEYACRAGGAHFYCGSDSIESVAWFTGNSKGSPHPVGGKNANAFGLHDMTGNVWEWVEDCYNPSYQGAPADGSTWTSRDCRRGNRRGGSWDSEPRISRAANRYWDEPTDRMGFYGFRPAKTLP